VNTHVGIYYHHHHHHHFISTQTNKSKHVNRTNVQDSSTVIVNDN